MDRTATRQRPLTLFERRVTVHQLRIFKMVADRRSFSRTAEQLHMSQPAISHQVKALSLAIGSPLFEEIGRRIQPTETGRVLYEHATRILAAFEAAERAIDEHQGLRSGEIRVVGDTTVGVYVLPDLLGSFKQTYPDVMPRLDVGNRQYVYERLLSNEADFAIVGRTWLRPDPPMTILPFLPNELIAIAAPTHPLAGARRVTLERLVEEPIILREVGSGTRETAEEALAKAGRQLHVAMELASHGAIKRTVARGLGIAILPRCAVALELQMGTVVELPVVGFPLHRQWHLVYPRDRRLGPVGQAFLDFVIEGSWRAAIGRDLTTE